MKNTGALLKAKRESSNLSLSEVALATKINPKILAAIERGEETSLPAKTILRGFLRSYAIFLKMDVDEVLHTFQAENAAPVSVAPAIPEEKKGEPVATSRRRVSDESSSGMRTIAVVVIVVLIGLIIGVREVVEKYQREKVVEQPVELLASPLMPEPQKPMAGETTTETKNVGEGAVIVTKPADTPGAPPAVLPLVTAPPPAPSVPTAEATVKMPPPAPAPEAAPEPAAESLAKPTKPAKHEIILEALDKVEVKFEVKGETKRISLGPTQVHTIHADQPLTLDLSDGGAVNIILDGRERGVPGDLGKPKTIKIP